METKRSKERQEILEGILDSISGALEEYVNKRVETELSARREKLEQSIDELRKDVREYRWTIAKREQVIKEVLERITALLQHGSPYLPSFVSDDLYAILAVLDQSLETYPDSSLD